MSATSRARLLELLADGDMHAGPALADRLGVSRTAVWKLVADLRRAGVDVASVDRRGYRLERPCELLAADAIGRAAELAGAPLPGDVEVHFALDSTNAFLYESPAPRPGRARIVFAEIQHAGRGRRGRSWLSPFGSGLTFSIAWSYPDVPAELSAIGLAMGVQVAETLAGEGAGEVMLKWPNDIVWRHRKIGGLLIQLKLEAGGAASVVVGFGLNVAMPDAVRESLATPDAAPVADLCEALGGRMPGRNALAGRLAGAMCAGLERFGRQGFAPFAGAWQALDSLSGALVRVSQSGGSVEGRAMGADHDGALRLEVDGRVERYFAGDVSLRRAAGDSV